MLSCVYSAGLSGIDGYIVTVESDAKKRIPVFELVGLPDAAVKEAKERVRAACENSGFQFPVLELTVNLAPADKRKEGTAPKRRISGSGIRIIDAMIEPVKLPQPPRITVITSSSDFTMVNIDGER